MTQTTVDTVASTILGADAWRYVRQMVIFKVGVLVIWASIVMFVLYPYYGWNSLVWLSGAGIGWWILDIDHLIDLLWIHTSGVGRYAWNCVRSGNLKKLVNLSISTANQRQKLLSRSVVFHSIIMVLALLSIWSTSIFIHGFILAVLGRMTIDQVWDYIHNKSLDRWWWQIRATVSPPIQRIWMIVGLLIWIGLTVLSLSV